MTSILMILYQKMILTLKRDKEATMMIMYKVTYFVKEEESGTVHTSVTNAEGVEGMLDNPALEVFGYIKVKEHENEKLNKW